MAIKIDNDLLQQLGLAGLPEHEKNSLLRHIYETLELNVGVRLADQMTNEQLSEFEQYFDAKDDAGAFKWLETNFPNYKDIVQQEFEKLKADIAQSAPQILAASQQTAMQQPVQPQAAPGAYQQPAYQAQPQYQQPVPQQFQQQPITPGYQSPQAPAQPYAAPPTPPQPAQQQYQQPSYYGQSQQQPQYPPQQPPAGPGGYQQPPQAS